MNDELRRGRPSPVTATYDAHVGCGPVLKNARITESKPDSGRTAGQGGGFEFTSQMLGRQLTLLLLGPLFLSPFQLQHLDIPIINNDGRRQATCPQEAAQQAAKQRVSITVRRPD